jgi:hypothetical protein
VELKIEIENLKGVHVKVGDRKGEKSMTRTIEKRMPIGRRGSESVQKKKT